MCTFFHKGCPLAAKINFKLLHLKTREVIYFALSLLCKYIYVTENIKTFFFNGGGRNLMSIRNARYMYLYTTVKCMQM